MSKSILVIDTPESCDVCNFADMVNGKMYCGIPGCGELVEDYIICRPDWCPLKAIPEKKTVCGKYPQPDGIVQSFKVGWNACIDEILKEGE